MRLCWHAGNAPGGARAQLGAPTCGQVNQVDAPQLVFDNVVEFRWKKKFEPT